ncbi:TetR-like C-terminal domain-containing protein [Nocardia sp. NPDC046763]|uniref:TetR/AcrR family transcriptional regulator n=1 Tax=Nocardia sp. NPDC046763 TaxID=3155256 RepID=UPI0033D0C568
MSTSPGSMRIASIPVVDTIGEDGSLPSAMAVRYSEPLIESPSATVAPGSFGDKAGLVRAVYFEGFRLLRAHLGEFPRTTDPRADLEAVMHAYRGWMLDHRVLAEIMFARPFTDFDPGPEELKRSAALRVFIVDLVQRCVDAGVVHGDATDIAHVVVALVQGLAAAEAARRLGGTAESVDRRWALALDSVLNGLAVSV